LLGVVYDDGYNRYGYEASGKHDRFISAIEEGLGLVAAALLPGAYLVDIIPVSGSEPPIRRYPS
jgi:hypothetical protein